MSVKNSSSFLRTWLFYGKITCVNNNHSPLISLIDQAVPVIRHRTKCTISLLSFVKSILNSSLLWNNMAAVLITRTSFGESSILIDAVHSAPPFLKGRVTRSFVLHLSTISLISFVSLIDFAFPMWKKLLCFCVYDLKSFFLSQIPRTLIGVSFLRQLSSWIVMSGLLVVW
jgi:hypothetical protein